VRATAAARIAARRKDRSMASAYRAFARRLVPNP
jgi:hypothetical protein